METSSCHEFKTLAAINLQQSIETATIVIDFPYISTLNLPAKWRDVDNVHYYTVRTVCGKRHKTVECPSICLSRRSTAAAVGGFAAEVGRGQQLSSA